MKYLHAGKQFYKKTDTRDVTHIGIDKGIY